MNKKTSMLFGASMVSMLLISACTGGGKEPAKEANQPKDVPPPAAADAPVKVSTDPVTLKFAINFSWLSEEERQKYIVDPVKKKYPNISFEWINLTETSLDKVIATGVIPDIVQSASPIINTYTDLGLADNMEPLIKSHKFDTSKISKAGLDAVKTTSGNDYLIGLPWTIQYSATYINKDIFDKFGVGYPKDGMTWEEMKDLSIKLTRKEGETQYRGLEPDVPSRLVSVLSAGYVDTKSNKASLDTEPWKRVFTLMKSIYDIPGNENYRWVPSAFDQFSKDRTLAMYPGLNYLPNFKSINGINWDIVQYPQFKEKPNISMQVDEWVLHVTKQSKYKDQAFQVISSILSDEVQTEMSRNARFPIVTTKSVQDELAKNLPYVQGKNLKAFFLSTPAAPVPPSKYAAYGSTVSQEAFKKVMKEGVDINSALREADEKLNKNMLESK
ncbi:ABC transporter substrate-binding protein [Paenibacillus ginsengarvi]|uniref:Extracellular solute-binding protein n=1 Tax=Paenibacillus ginsengarvi TaxID=400777 RepID=A0A3B0CH47_9BACL|nr:extracellular solute-binding protein [Paenibacillus ginsengarvi]RKN84460.1 extracellular solute-binding protein [Paenibacillus ginsengarvi]